MMKKETKRSAVKRALWALAGILLFCVLAVGGYVLYMQMQYYRIEDHLALETENNQKEALQTGKTYTAVTYNIGFGAYGPDYSFFMDTGEMNDGTATAGKYGESRQ